MSQHDTGKTGRSVQTALHPPSAHRPGIVDIHRAADEIVSSRGDDTEEFVVSVEVYDVLLVRAKSPEEALAKAVTGNPDGSDLDMDYVTHDVHACVHSGEEHKHGGDEEE